MLVIKYPRNQLKFLVRGSYNAHTDYKTGNGERLTNSRFNTYDLKAGIGYQTSSMKTELRYNLNASELGIPEEIGAQTRSYIPITPNQQIYNHVLSSKTKLFLKNSSIEAILGYTNNNRKEFEEDLLNPALEMHLATFNYNLRYELPNWGDLETLVGVQGMRQTNKNFGEEQLIPDAKTKDIGVFATSHLHIGDKSGLQLGLRYDHRNIDAEVNENPPLSSFYENLNRDFHSFNSSVGYKFNISKNIESRINLASGFRAPNLAELTSNGVHEGTNRYEIGNNELNNEQNFQTDVSLEFKNDHIAFFINGFYNTIKDYIFIEPDGTFVLGDPVFLYTQQNASLQGGEIGFHLHPHPLDWLHFESSFETVIGKKRNGGYLPLIPANSLTNTLRVEMGPGSKSIRITDAFLSLKSVFDQTKIDTFETSTPGYNLVHLGLGLTMQNVEIRVGCNNVFNQNYISHLSRLKIDGIANIGRNITVSAAIPI